MPASAADRLQAGAKVAVRDRRGRTLRHLEIKRRLAEGAHNATYLARDIQNERWVVVKTSLLGGEDTELAIEEQILLQLDSPHLVQLLGGGADARLHKVLAYERLYPNPLLVLSAPQVRTQFPYDPGGRYCPLPPRMALALITDLFRGLAHLHAEGFVHHDVKLGNLLVAIDSAEGRPLPAHEILKAAALGQTRGVLIDFGAARSAAFLRELNQGLASEVPPQLTPLYAPPEALLEVAGRRTLLPSLDLYAAALVSYSLFCGRTPYEHLGISASDVRRILQVKAEEQRGAELPISFEYLTLAPGISELGKELFGFLSCCLSGDPSQRPSAQEASGFCEELQSWYHEALAAAPEKVTPAPGEAAASLKQTSSPPDLSRDKKRRGPASRSRPAKTDPALAETAEAPVEEDLGDGFSTSAESAVSAQRLREQSRERAGPDDSDRGRTRARPSQRAARPRPNPDRPDDSAQVPSETSPASETSSPSPSEASPPSETGLPSEAGPSPGHSKRQGAAPPSERMRRQAPSRQARRPGPASSERMRRQGKQPPPSERMQRQGNKPPPSERMQRQGKKAPPSERMQRQGKKPPPSERMQRQGNRPPPSERMQRQGKLKPPPSERMQRRGKPASSERLRGKRPSASDEEVRPPSLGSGPRTPRRGLPAVGSGPRTPRGGLPAVDPAALGLPEVREEPSSEEHTSEDQH